MLRDIAAAVGLLAAASMAYAAPAAHVVFVAGQAHIATHPLVLGDSVNEGDEIATGADGYVYMKTIDDGFLILRPNSRAHITAYHIDEQTPSNTRVKIELLNGVGRSISGLGVKKARQNFRLNTPVAAIGVRGTDFTVFTDQQVTRIEVASGGVVVSGFGGACLPEGGGPCEGVATRELFADKTGQLLQVQKGQKTPQILRSNGISPDLNAPPRPDEPTSKTSSIGNATLASADLSLAPQKSADLNAVGTQPVASATPTQTPTPTPISTSAPVSSPDPVTSIITATPIATVFTQSPPELIWGRWQVVANLPADSAGLAKLVPGGGYAAGYDVGPFFISRVDNTQLVMPSSGQASFALTGSEAYISVAGQQTVAASVQNAQLNVNFSQSTFNTSLTVSAPGEQVLVSGQGSVTNQGVLINDIIYSNATIRGYLGGANAQQAGYIFQTNNSPTVSAFGGTTWAR